MHKAFRRPGREEGGDKAEKRRPRSCEKHFRSRARKWFRRRLQIGPGRVAFRFYYNPRVDDRRLAFDPSRNILRPGPKEPAHVFETQQP